VIVALAFDELFRCIGNVDLDAGVVDLHSFLSRSSLTYGHNLYQTASSLMTENLSERVFFSGQQKLKHCKDMEFSE
jgi:hypothetical protein